MKRLVFLLTIIVLLCSGCIVADVAADTVDVAADTVHTAADAI